MKYLFRISFLLLTPLLFSIHHLAAQTPFYDVEYIDVNNIKAATGLHGDLWHSWSGTQIKSGCEFPKGSGKHIGFSGSLWMGGYDPSHTLRCAATSYRTLGQEYWPGPLQGSNSSITYAESENWALIWKINKSDIAAFLATPVHTLANTDPMILEWPAKQNLYARGRTGMLLSITEDMAPFVDVDHDGVYNALQGDYPDMKGDQMLWFVFNDNGPSPHNEITNTLPLGVEVKAIVYAYSSNTSLGNMLFYEYTLKNKQQDLDSFALGLFADLDLGSSTDDYVGFDSSRNMAYQYNGRPTDGTGAPSEYSDSIPTIGIRMLEFSGNDCSNRNSLGSFMYIMNAAGPRGDAASETDVYHYLNHTWRDGSPLVAPYSDSWGPHVEGYGAGGPSTRYVYDGDTFGVASFGWTECLSQNMFADRRFVIASPPVNLSVGDTLKFSFALVASNRKKNNGCPYYSLSGLNAVSDYAQAAFCNPGLTSLSTVNADKEYQLFPNPAKDKLTIKGGGQSTSVNVYSALGQKQDISYKSNGNDVELDMSVLAPGLYTVIIQAKGRIASKIMKQ
jgi:hypothetical protein